MKGVRLRMVQLVWWVPLLVFMAAVLLNANEVGIYMDAVNPDFMAAQWLHRGHNPGAGLPSKFFLILGSLYHGVQNAYAGLLVFPVLGFSPTSLRFEQALFGLVLLAALMKLAHRLTGSKALAWITGLGLATELAFTTSFLTQFYIVVGGAAWFFVSLLLALPADEYSRVIKRRLFWSGFFSGLAVYGYFVLAFFLPGTFLVMALQPGRTRHDRRAWLIGLAVGMLPFAFGYFSLVWKLHGVAPTISFLKQTLGLLKPFGEGGASGGNLEYAWNMVSLSVTNTANEGMLLGGVGAPTLWAVAKFRMLVVTSVGLITAALLFAIRGGRRRALVALPVVLPLCYIAVASLFGQRLWAHHYSVLVPFVYLLPCLVVGLLPAAAAVPSRMRMVGAGLAGIILLAANVQQQAALHERLASTGGAGKSSDALVALAAEARGVPTNIAYVFPEWGFFTSFCFLTGNRVRYAVDASPASFQKLKAAGITEFRLVYWDAANESEYRRALSSTGTSAATSRDFMTRDGRPAFKWLRATL